MTSNWRLKKLKEVIKLEYGKPLDKTKREIKGLYPVYGANGEKARSNEYYFDKKSIIVGRKGSAGEINITTEKFWPLDVTYFVTFDKKQYDLKFLFHLLNTLNLPRLAKGVKPGINRNDVYSLDVLIPPLPEQKRIVKILDEAFAAIDKATANAEKNLQNSRELFDSYLNKVFANPGEDWEEKKLHQLGVVQTGTTPKTSQKENFGNYIPFIKPALFNSDGSICYDTEGLSEIGLKKSRHIAEKSMLMVCIGATIGKTGFTEKSISCNQQINSLTTKAEYHSKFFYYAMLTKSFQADVVKNSGQATLPIINKTKWSNLTISFPKGKEDQKQLSDKFDKLTTERKKLEAIYQQKLTDLEELKKSILQKAFEGEL